MEASRREARPRPTGTGGGATGTETAKPPGTGRTAHPKQAGGKRRPQEHAKRPAAAAEEKRATATKPDRERSDGRNETPSAPPAQGAKAARAERTTDEAAGNNEEEATGHPPGKRPTRNGRDTPPAGQGEPTRPRHAQGRVAAKRTLARGAAGRHHRAAFAKEHKQASQPQRQDSERCWEGHGAGRDAPPMGEPRAAKRGVAPGRAKAARRIRPLGTSPRPTGRAEQPGTGEASDAVGAGVGLDAGFCPPETPMLQQKGGDGGRGRQAGGARSHHHEPGPGAPAERRERRAARPDAPAPESAPPREGPLTQRSACAPGARRPAGMRVGSCGRERRRIAFYEPRRGRLRSPRRGVKGKNIPE